MVAILRFKKFTGSKFGVSIQAIVFAVYWGFFVFWQARKHLKVLISQRESPFSDFAEF